MALAPGFSCRTETICFSLSHNMAVRQRRFAVTRSNNPSKVLGSFFGLPIRNVRLQSGGKTKRPVRVHWSIFGIGWLLAIGLAQAGPPFVTDDPEPPPPGGWEINVPFILERTPGKTEMDAPLFDLNYGLPNVQLKLEIPIAIAHNDGDGKIGRASCRERVKDKEGE